MEIFIIFPQVRHSKLKSKQALYSELRTCAKVVKDTSRQLLKWDFTVVGGVNRYLSLQYWILTSLTLWKVF